MHINKYQNKKGFTLVELAIVLVVIGLLLGMALKGKTLIEAARSKADYQKINKIAAAVNIYTSKYGTLPGLNKNGVTVPTVSPKLFFDELIKEGLLKHADFRITSVGVAYLNVVGCMEITEAGGNKTWEILDATENTKICLYNTNISPANMADAENVTYAKKSPIPRYLVCQIESLVDDKNIYNGDGRAIKDGAQALDITDYDCAKYLNDPDGTSKDGAYAYRIY